MRKNINKTFIISIIFYVVITFLRMINHTPWLDEARAWTLAQELNLFQIMNYMKIEGHLFVWYLIMMPFAKANLWYPYSMLFLNWMFAVLAVIFMWLKAPFNNITKVCITFSFPFLAYYSVVARCYAVGILCLFALAYFYKDKMNHPNIYSFLLIITANTSVMAIFGATAFGILFLYNLIKNKSKQMIYPIIILFIGAFLVLYQMLGADPHHNVLIPINFSIKFFENVFVLHNPILNIFLLLIFAFLLIKFLIERKQSLVFLLSTYLLLFLEMRFVYTGYFWHHYFFYIYLIIAIWIGYGKNNLAQKFAVGVLTIVSFIFIFNFNYESFENLSVFSSVTKNWVKVIKTHKEFDKATIVILDLKDTDINPFFKNTNVQIKEFCTGERVGYKTFAQILEGCSNVGHFGYSFNKINQFLSVSKDRENVYFILSKIEMPSQILHFENIILSKYGCINTKCLYKLENFTNLQ